MFNTNEILWFKSDQTTARFLQPMNSLHQEIIAGKNDILNKGFWIGLLAYDTSSVCDDNTDTIFLEFNGQSEIDFMTNPPMGCTPLETKLTPVVIGGSDVASYYWEILPNLSSKERNPTFNIRRGGSYDVKLITESKAGCTDTLTKKDFLIALQSPEAYFSASALLTTLDEATIEFVNKSSYYSNESELIWDFNDGSISAVSNPQHTFIKPGKYEVELNIINPNLCSDTHAERIIIEEGLKIYIPNAFSPNGDGINDEFKVAGLGINNFSIKIYDRWGSLIYVSNDFSKHSWKNKNNAPLGVYTYVVYATDFLSRAYQYSGTITLVR